MTLAPGSDPLNRIAGITQWLAGLKYSDWMMKVSTANQRIVKLRSELS